MKEYFENESVFWTPISKCCWLETKSRNQKDIWNCWPCFSPTPFFCQTVNPISTKEAWTPNSKCCWLETKSRNQKDIRNCWLCFSPNPFCFTKQLTLFQPRGLGHQIWCFENESTLKKCCWLHSFLAMKAKSKNQKYIWTCWLCFSPAPIFCQTFYPISTNVAWTPISKCCWLETKSRNQKDIWNCWPRFSRTPIFLPNS